MLPWLILSSNLNHSWHSMKNNNSFKNSIVQGHPLGSVMICIIHLLSIKNCKIILNARAEILIVLYVSVLHTTSSCQKYQYWEPYINTGTFAVQKTSRGNQVCVESAVNGGRIKYPLFPSYCLTGSKFEDKCIQDVYRINLLHRRAAETLVSSY